MEHIKGANVEKPCIVWPSTYYERDIPPETSQQDRSITDDLTPDMTISILAGLVGLDQLKDNPCDLLPAFFAYTRGYIPGNQVTGICSLKQYNTYVILIEGKHWLRLIFIALKNSIRFERDQNYKF